MNAETKIEAEKRTGLDLLREPFPPHQISKLPKPTKRQTDDVRADFKKGIRCEVCGGWHHPKVVHLDYVGHAALTDRLLDSDPNWNWEPVSTAEDGTPALDANGGMWIRLTVCGVTRLGYGHPDGKKGGDAIKETIGDALRNAAMRFGAALDLWHKGDLHGIDGPTDDGSGQGDAQPDAPQFDAAATHDRIKAAIIARADAAALDALWNHPKTAEAFGQLPAPMQAELTGAYTEKSAELSAPADDLAGDEIPY